MLAMDHVLKIHGDMWQVSEDNRGLQSAPILNNILQSGFLRMSTM